MSRKQVLVVGASGGIGRGIAQRLAADGWDILAHGRSEEKLTETAALVEAQGASCRYFRADLAEPTQLDTLIDWALSQAQFSAVVWTAGGGKAVDAGPDAIPEWQRTLNVTLHAPMQLVAKTLPHMKAQAGAYLFIAGMYAKIGMARMAAHCAGRHALEGFSKALFEEVREDGVRVTLLHPGFVFTPLSNTERLDPAKMIQVEDVAQAAATALNLPANACVTEIVLRPQRSPYRHSS